MLYISIFDAKENVSRAEINRERSEWIRKGSEAIFAQKCKRVTRYEVLGTSPLKIVLVIDTDDPSSLHMISTHFGNAWKSVTYPVIERGIAEALEEDHYVIGG